MDRRKKVERKRERRLRSDDSKGVKKGARMNGEVRVDLNWRERFVAPANAKRLDEQRPKEKKRINITPPALFTDRSAVN
jgi:hypothetical protein